MKNQQKEAIHRLRSKGYSYKKIANQLCLSENTIQSYCRRNNLGGIGKDKTMSSAANFCKQCGEVLMHTIGKKKKQFCSDQCRMRWWNDHPEVVHHKNKRIFTCKLCGHNFEEYGKRERKYCSQSCYQKSKAVSK